MSDTNEVEERLFLALETIEKLTERAAQSQSTIEQLQKLVAEQQNTLITDAQEKMTEINTTYDHVNEVMFQGVYQAISKNISPIVADLVKKSVENATDLSVANLVSVIEERTKQVKDLVRDEAKLTSRVVFDASKELERMTAKMKAYENSLAKKHYLLVSQFFLGLVSILCIVFFIFYKITVPTSSELQNLRLQNNTLRSEQATLIYNNQRIRNSQSN